VRTGVKFKKLLKVTVTKWERYMTIKWVTKQIRPNVQNKM